MNGSKLAVVEPDVEPTGWPTTTLSTDETDDEAAVQQESLMVLSERRSSADTGDNPFSQTDSPIARKTHSVPMNSPNSWTDVPFLIAFAVLQVMVFYFAFWLGVPIVTASTVLQNDTALETTETTSTAPIGLTSDDASLLTWVALVWLAGAVWSIAALGCLLFFCHSAALPHSQYLMPAAYLSAPVSLLLLALPALVSTRNVAGYIFAAIALFCGILLLWSFKDSPSVNVAALVSSTLKTAGVAVRHHVGLIPVALLVSFLSLGYFVVWSLALIGSSELGCHPVGYIGGVSRGDPQKCRQLWRKTLASLLLFLALLWTLQVLNTVVEFTAIRTVGTWWRRTCPHSGTPSTHTTVATAFLDAGTRRLGSICLASLVVPVVNVVGTAVVTLPYLFLFSLPGFVWVKTHLQAQYNFALVHVAMYHCPVSTARRQVKQLFQHAGWTSNFHDLLVFRVVWMCRVTVATLTGLTGMVIYRNLVLEIVEGASDLPFDDLSVLSFLGGFVSGLLANHAFLSILEGSARAVVVCWAEDPAALARRRMDLLEQMAKGFCEAYPLQREPF